MARIMKEVEIEISLEEVFEEYSYEEILETIGLDEAVDTFGTEAVLEYIKEDDHNALLEYVTDNIDTGNLLDAIIDANPDAIQEVITASPDATENMIRHLEADGLVVRKEAAEEVVSKYMREVTAEEILDTLMSSNILAYKALKKAIVKELIDKAMYVIEDAGV